MTETFSRFDAADYLETPEDIAAYLEAAAEDGDPSTLAAALGAVAARKKHDQARRRGRDNTGRAV